MQSCLRTIDKTFVDSTKEVVTGYPITNLISSVHDRYTLFQIFSKDKSSLLLANLIPCSVKLFSYVNARNIFDAKLLTFVFESKTGEFLD